MTSSYRNNVEETLKQHLEEYQRLLLAEKYLVTIGQKIAHERRQIVLLEKNVELEYQPAIPN